MMVLLVCTFILIAIIRTIYVHIERKYDYWKNKNVRHMKPTLIFGNYGDYILQKKSMGEMVQELCKRRPREAYIAAYFGTQPVLIVQDPDLIKTILTMDFYYFNSRELMDYIHGEHMNSNLYYTYGDKWKVLRQNFTTLFSPIRMKNMFPLIEKCALRLETLLDEEKKENEVIDSRNTMVKYTMDMIATCVFGMDINTQTDDAEKNSFLKIGEMMFDKSFFRALAICSRSAWPGIFYGLGLRVLPKTVTNFFYKTLTSAFESRQHQHKPSTRNDFIDLLLTFKQKSYMTADNFIHRQTSEKLVVKVDDHLLSAQCMTFFAAGYETSSAAMSFTLYELAKNEDVQFRVIQEIDCYLRRHNNKLDYDCVTELPYLEACVNEAMRLYPALGVITRQLFEDYTLPTGLRLEKGLLIHLPVYHLHHNPDYFCAPDQFRPERFLDERCKIRPYTYMPFGEGPRICMGMRFARMETMSGLITVLKKYHVKLPKCMPRQLELDPRSIVTQAKGNIRLQLVLRDNWELRQFDPSHINKNGYLGI